MNGCTKWHHQTLHKDEKIETSLQGISGSASVCDNNIADSCLLQLQRIPTNRDWVNVLWDSGASLYFITNDKAKAERLRGKKVELSIIKIGGDFSKEVNKITFDFIWNHKPAKIKKTTLVKQKTAGGLDMKDFSLFDKALKLNWVKRLCFNSDAPWQYIPKSLLADVGGTELFKCNYDYNLLDTDNHLPAFYKEIIFY